MPQQSAQIVTWFSRRDVSITLGTSATQIVDATFTRMRPLRIEIAFTMTVDLGVEDPLLERSRKKGNELNQITFNASGII